MENEDSEFVSKTTTFTRFPAQLELLRSEPGAILQRVHEPANHAAKIAR